MDYQPIRGTKDFLFEQSELYRTIVDSALDTARCYGFSEIYTPIFESSNVFQKTLGESSDVVSKEMYMLEDRGGESLTLRPEGTAPIARAVLSNSLTQSLPLKFFYHGPMFRYERPQKGRSRQFHQIGVELLGPQTPIADAEMIQLGYAVLQDLGLESLVTVHINTLGDTDSRQAYRNALVGYLTPLQDQLSEDSQKRLVSNPMRILDSKNEEDQKLLENAPKLHDFLSTEASSYFNEVQTLLSQLGIPFEVNQKLVRGLDYYCHTAFEFIADSKLGSQNAVGGGGRYDGLIKQMGGPHIPAIGWAMGIERLMLLLEDSIDFEEVKLAVVPAGPEQEVPAFLLAQRLRAEGLYVDMGYSGNVSKRMKKAAQQKALFALILGEDEINNGTITVKDLQSGSQQTVSSEDIIEHMNEAIDAI